MNLQTLFTGWHFMRWLRLGAGIFILVQALQTHDMLAGFIGGFFLLQAATNTGCCGTQACAMPMKRKDITTEPVEYEEVTPE